MNRVASTNVSAGSVTSPKSLIMDQTARLCTTVYKRHLRSLVLTGSIARDEGTFVSTPDGHALLGDAEFFAVFHDGHARPAAADLRLVEQRLYDRLRAEGLIARVSLTAVHARYFRGITPSIFGYELRTCGVIAAGEPDILKLIPAFDRRDIPLEDAWRLLANRLVEQLAGFDELIADRPTLSSEAYYRTIKLYLDMGTSLLLFNGAYAPTYREREAALRQLGTLPGANAAPFPLEAFTENVSTATRWKLGATTSFRTAPRAFWERAIEHAEQLWRWELSRLTDLPAEGPSHELLSKWIERQSLTARLRGWAHVIRQQGLRGTLSRWPRWIRAVAVASPRYLTYAAAIEALFAVARSSGSMLSPTELHRLGALCQRLPLPGPLSEASAQNRGRELAATCLRSYNDFLVNTRT
jgi:hypothetical protein